MIVANKKIQPSWELCNTPELRTQLLEEIEGNSNERHDLEQHGDPSKIEGLRRRQSKLLEQLESQADQLAGFPPRWIVPVMKAGWYFADGDYPTALKHDLEAAPHADSDKRRAISARNISNEHRKLENTAEAVESAELAIQLEPKNPISWLVLAMAYFTAGDEEKADNLLLKLIEAADFANDHDALARCLAYEAELLRWDHLKSVRELKRLAVDTCAS